MHCQNTLRTTGLVLSVLLLAGCAANQNKPADGTDNKGSAATSSNEKPSASAVANEARIAQARQAAQASVVIPNPSTVLFEKMGTTIDDKGKQIVAQLAERARGARKVTVTGFCDRNQIGNSADAAVARAISVRDELLAQGVVPANILVRFNTKVAKKHAAEVRFD